MHPAGQAALSGLAQQGTCRACLLHTDVALSLLTVETLHLIGALRAAGIEVTLHLFLWGAARRAPGQSTALSWQ
jgi:hypothetical protein